MVLWVLSQVKVAAREIVPVFSVWSKALAVTEALGGFGLECFSSDPLVRPLGHINPGAIGWRIRLGNHKMVGVGRLETGKVQAVWFSSIFPLLFGPCVELDFHNKALKFVRYAHWDLRSYAAAAP